MDIQIGSNIGDYQVIGILGAGGMGKVYKVRNVISDRVEAMKVLLPDLVSAPELADRFLREIKVQAALEHPNIAALHTAVRVDNQLLMLMEFVEGETIEHKLEGGRLPVSEAVDYISQVLSALEYAHAHGVIHRDIKPANIMLTSSGTVKLMDFGIAKAASDKRLTATGLTMGSLYYMSPEQIQGAATLDGRADLYSAGVSLYEMVTGKRPFEGDSQFAIMAAHLKGTPIPPIAIDPNLPKSLNDAVLMAVAKDPKDRFQSAAAFRNALKNVAASATPAPDAAAAVAPAAAQPRGRRGLWMAVGAVAAVAALVAAIELAPKKKTEAARSPVVPQQNMQTAPSSTPPIQQAPVPLPAPVEQQQDLQAKPPLQLPLQPPVENAKPPARQPRESARAPQTPTQTPPAPVQDQAAPPPVQQKQSNPGQATPSAPQQTTAQPGNAAELQQVREQLAMLHVRVNGIRSSLMNLQRAQSASGLGLSSALQEPADLMNSFIQGANEALSVGDAAGAKSLMDKAERQVEKLEKLLNR